MLEAEIINTINNKNNHINANLTYYQMWQNAYRRFSPLSQTPAEGTEMIEW